MPTLKKLQGSLPGMGDTMHKTVIGVTHNKQKATAENKTRDIVPDYAGDPRT